MKRALSLALTAIFALTIVGCHASIEPNDTSDTDSHYKKTTTYNRDGTVTTETKTETNRNP
jgi:hypothetical protein